MEEKPHWTPDGVRLLDRANGTAAPPPERPNPLRRERWVDMGELYPGHQLLLRFNPSRKGLAALPDDASQEQQIRAGLQRIVLAHRVHVDGQPDSPWIDPDTDQPMPSPATDAFWELIGNETLATIMAYIAADQKKVQASIEESSGTSIAALQAGPLPSPSGTSGGSSLAAGSVDQSS